MLQPKEYSTELHQKAVKAVFNANEQKEINQAKKLLEFALNVQDIASCDRKEFGKSFKLLMKADDKELIYRELSHGWKNGKPKVSVIHTKEKRGDIWPTYEGRFDKLTGEKMTRRSPKIMS